MKPYDWNSGTHLKKVKTVRIIYKLLLLQNTRQLLYSTLIKLTVKQKEPQWDPGWSIPVCVNKTGNYNKLYWRKTKNNDNAINLSCLLATQQ